MTAGGTERHFNFLVMSCYMEKNHSMPLQRREKTGSLMIPKTRISMRSIFSQNFCALVLGEPLRRAPEVPTLSPLARCTFPPSTSICTRHIRYVLPDTAPKAGILFGFLAAHSRPSVNMPCALNECIECTSFHRPNARWAGQASILPHGQVSGERTLG